MSGSSVALVLHGHVPFVLNHGRWPHGEHWLFEAVAETWLPLLQIVDALHRGGARCPITLGLGPVLLEQLASPQFQARFPVYLAEREQRAHADERSFGEWGDHHLAALARGWADLYQDLADRFDALERDLPREIARLWDVGAIEVLSSAATHAYLPLLLHDASCRAQVRLGLETSERVLGRRPQGFWLPECGYRPGGSWTPPTPGREARRRAGLDALLAEEGVAYTLIDARLLRGARSEGLLDDGGFRAVGWDQAGWDEDRAWRSPLEPHLVSSSGDARGVQVLARHPEIAEQVLSPSVGYPSDGRYLEFHKRHGEGGLRYWGVTSARAGLADKQRHEPEAAAEAVRSHAQAFCAVLRSALRRHERERGRPGVAVAAFRAELFGHWWHEGPDFLRAVLEGLCQDPSLEVRRVGEVLEAQGCDKVVRLPEGSWAESGDHQPWLQPSASWMWQVLYNAEDRFGQLCLQHPWREDAELRGLLELAGRELLLMQASDWPFIVGSGAVADYGIKRFAQHATRFDRCCDAVDDHLASRPLSAALAAALAEARASAPVFPSLSLTAWEQRGGACP